jgi:hypothetical protein
MIDLRPARFSDFVVVVVGSRWVCEERRWSTSWDLWGLMWHICVVWWDGSGGVWVGGCSGVCMRVCGGGSSKYQVLALWARLLAEVV